MASTNGFGRKYGRKNDQNLPNFFFQKKDIKKRSETKFHKNRRYRTNSSLYLRHGSERHFFELFGQKTEILENSLRNHAGNIKILKNQECDSYMDFYGNMVLRTSKYMHKLFQENGIHLNSILGRLPSLATLLHASGHIQAHLCA